jgi:hypothetical protein
MKARNQNADPNYPLKMNAEHIYNEIRNTILAIAKAERKKNRNQSKNVRNQIPIYTQRRLVPHRKMEKELG